MQEVHGTTFSKFSLGYIKFRILFLFILRKFHADERQNGIDIYFKFLGLWSSIDLSEGDKLARAAKAPGTSEGHGVVLNQEIYNL